MSAFRLEETPVHLGLGASVQLLEPFDGTQRWYERYARACAADGAEGRLVALHTFNGDWPTWEMHPRGAELVYVVSGEMTLIQEIGGERGSLRLVAGDAAINPPGVWHTARVAQPTTALFITAGEGTLNEVRD